VGDCSSTVGKLDVVPTNPGFVVPTGTTLEDDYAD